MRFTKEEVKREFIRLYGESFDEIYYRDFDEFFDDTWENWCPNPDTNLDDLYEIVVDIAEMPQPPCHPSEGWRAEEEYFASQKRIWEEIEQKMVLQFQKELEEIKKYEAWQEENFEWEEEE